MIHVSVKDSSQEAFDHAMRILKKKVQNDGFIQEIKERRYFKKPSEIKRAKHREWERLNCKRRKRGK